jgi:hypothetical protein
MMRLCAALMVVSMAIWPFPTGKAQEGDGAGYSRGALSARIDALERKIEMLEDKIIRLEKRASAAQGGADGVASMRTTGVDDRGPCPGQWRQIGGGWVCIDPNAK